MAGLGAFRATSPDGTVDVSDELLSIAGIESGTFDPTFEALVGLVVEDDRDALRAVHAASWKGETTASLGIRVRRPSGEVRSVHVYAQPSVDREGRVEAVEGTVLDVTDVRALEQDLQVELRLNTLASQLARVGGWSLDLATHELSWSDTHFDIFELPRGEPPSVDEALAFFPSPWRERLTDVVDRAIQQGAPYDEEAQLVTATGHRIWIRTVGRPRVDATGSVVAVEGAIQDIDARKRSEERLEEARHLQERLLSTLPAQVALLDADGTILEVNERWREFGRENGASDPTFGVGRNYIEVSRSAYGRDADASDAVANGLRKLLDGERDVLSLEYPCHTPDHERWYQLEARAIAADSERRAVLMHLDVTANHDAQERLAYLAFHDPLTGLLNRAGLARELSRRLERSWPPNHVLVELDLKDMASVNETHGFDAGDGLLKSIGSRLAVPASARPPDLVARTGGDQFALLMGPDGTAALGSQSYGDGAVEAARTLIGEAMGSLHELATSERVRVDARVGLTRLTERRREVEDLLREAQLALHEGRGPDIGDWAEYDVRYDAEVRERRQLTDELQQAIERSELRLHYHPTVDAGTGSLASAEALVRWQHPERGLLPPGAFVPDAERSGLIVPLGRWVLDEACRKMALWRDPLQLTRIAVNASAEELMQPSYTTDVLEALERHGVDPTMLTIEVTETALVRDPELAANHLQTLRDAGVRLALDDFGTGYASLAILKQFPFEHVKIDRLFVNDILTDPYSRSVIESVLALAKAIDASVVGEGVETEEQLSALVEIGCEIAQGYYFCLPLAEDDFEWLLRTRPSLPVSASA
jgi:diguanylate cyclase (GGDEF)-like protein